MSKKMNDEFKIRNLTVKNRLCVPPMVIFGYSDESGMVSEKNIEHYRGLAKGGFGLIIQEATVVSPEGKLSKDQLGIWSDEHIPGLKKIVEAVHAESTPILIQIHHAGVVGVPDEPMCPSDYEIDDEGNLKHGHAMTAEEIKTVQQAYISAAVRAYKAGYDGVELHGCHSYLISQFFNSRVNRRTDRYKDPMNFVSEIIDGIRKETPADFILGIRLGAFEPTLSDGIAHAVALEKVGVDFIDVSYGFTREQEAECPTGWPYMDIVYAAGEIKKNVSVPVFAVNSICTPEQASGILEATDVDMTDIGRSALVDFNWANKALSGEEPGKCIHCRECFWRVDPERCAGRKLMNRKSKA